MYGTYNSYYVDNVEPNFDTHNVTWVLCCSMSQFFWKCIYLFCPMSKVYFIILNKKYLHQQIFFPTKILGLLDMLPT